MGSPWARAFGFECKSYLDSLGVQYKSLADPKHIWASNDKIFTKPIFRTIVAEALVKQVVGEGMALPNPTLKYCLVTGHIATTTDRTKLHAHFDQEGWGSIWKAITGTVSPDAVADP